MGALSLTRKSENSIVSHRSSYTYQFAVRLQNRWLEMFGKELPLIDLADGLLKNRATFAVRPRVGSQFDLDQKLQRVIYAFHPQVSTPVHPDYFQNQAMASLYASALFSASCPNMPLLGNWGLHLSFLRGRRILQASGLPVAPVRTLAPGCPSSKKRTVIKPFQSFLLPVVLGSQRNLEVSQLEFQELDRDWQDQIYFTHVVGEHVLTTSYSGLSVRPSFKKSQYSNIAKLTGSQALEIIEYKNSYGEMKAIGIHPCLTSFPQTVVELLHAQTERLR